ncbi:MAG TPA: glycosyltransferase family 4 protein [Thermoleophilia bacterium]
MKICLINYRYFVSSGPERYLFGVKGLLEERGHEVVPFSVRYRANEASPYSRYFVEPLAGDDQVYFRQQSWTPSSLRRSLERAVYSREVYDSLSRLLRDTRPDVAYVLHYLRKLSPAVLAALHDAGVPIVVRFSDFAMVCPQAHLVRDDRVCELCVGHGLWPSVRHRCVQGSAAASAVNAVGMTWARRRGYFDFVDTFVTPSAIMAQKMVEGGLPAGKMVHIPTFVRPRTPRPFAERRRRICYVGRMERIKGIEVLLEAFEIARRRGLDDEVELVFAGNLDTPGGAALRARLHARPVPGVRLVGQIDEDAIIDLLQSCQLSVVPSLWYENTPNSLLESLACGTPVVSSDLGSMREVVAGTGVGLLFKPGDAEALADTLLRALTSADLEEMGRCACAEARGRYGAALHVDRLEGVLTDAMDRPRR